MMNGLAFGVWAACSQLYRSGGSKPSISKERKGYIVNRNWTSNRPIIEYHIVAQRVKIIISHFMTSSRLKHGISKFKAQKVPSWVFGRFGTFCYDADFVDAGALMNIRTRRLSGSVRTPCPTRQLGDYNCFRKHWIAIFFIIYHQWKSHSFIFFINAWWYGKR